eukprot:7472025-Pyramimonas_sp.AAC.1
MPIAKCHTKPGPAGPIQPPTTALSTSDVDSHGAAFGATACEGFTRDILRGGALEAAVGSTAGSTAGSPALKLWPRRGRTATSKRCGAVSSARMCSQ